MTRATAANGSVLDGGGGVQASSAGPVGNRGQRGGRGGAEATVGVGHGRVWLRWVRRPDKNTPTRDTSPRTRLERCEPASRGRQTHARGHQQLTPPNGARGRRWPQLRPLQCPAEGAQNRRQAVQRGRPRRPAPPPLRSGGRQWQGETCSTPGGGNCFPALVWILKAGTTRFQTCGVAPPPHSAQDFTELCMRGQWRWPLVRTRTRTKTKNSLALRTGYSCSQTFLYVLAIARCGSTYQRPCV